MKYTTKTYTTLADTLTPIIAYQRIREAYPVSLLFECSIYQDSKNSNSILVFDQLAHISLENGTLCQSFGQEYQQISTNKELHFERSIRDFQANFELTESSETSSFNGIYGFSGYDSVSTMESVAFDPLKTSTIDIPDFYYGFFRFILVFHHHTSSLTLFENVPEGTPTQSQEILQRLQKNNSRNFHFEKCGEETANISADDFKTNVSQAIEHCQKGDTFQMVLSRRFSQSFLGDDFNVYRSLRSLNPSPYLFYADFGGFRLMGSSPEAQLIVSNRQAEIHPIAGTFKKTENTTEDFAQTKKLRDDPKENAEHVMLVDLARNDLSRHCNEVKISSFKEIQNYSHVIHMVSKVEGTLLPKHSSLALFAHTFPAGTLSGAPKIEAMNLINQLETESRNFYGGAIGSFSFNGDINHAIIIRSICSKDHVLHFQAGAGVVVHSSPENELKEVDHKVGALRAAINNAHAARPINFAL